MNTLIKTCFLYLALLPFSLNQAWCQEKFGQYTGVFQNTSLNQEQLAKLELISTRQAGNELRLIGILSLYFGDFNSSEYVSYHFDSVKYNLLTGVLVFDQPDQKITFVVANFSGENLEATLRSSVAGEVGKLVLKRGSTVNTTKPLVQQVWGEYRGLCNGVTHILQVQTMRSTSDTSRVGDPFGTYEIKAQLGEINPSACLPDNPICAVHVYDSGSYDYFSGEMQLFGINNDLNCQVLPTGINCNGCQLNRKSNELAQGSRFAIPGQTYSWPSDTVNPDTAISIQDSQAENLAGTYTGYVFHERLGVFQKSSLNLVTYQAPGTSGGAMQLMMSGVATLYFGQKTPQESLVYSFNEKPYALMTSQIVFERIDGDADAVVHVTKLSNGVAKGIWYSILYGRVGTFELRKDGKVPLPSDAKTMDSISGKYASQQWLVDLNVGRESTPINTRNPFFPLNFKGFARMPGLTANKQIVGGSYDFYTGKISFILDDGTLFAGSRTSRDNFYLKRPTPAAFRPMNMQPFQKFVLIDP